MPSLQDNVVHRFDAATVIQTVFDKRMMEEATHATPRVVLTGETAVLLHETQFGFILGQQPLLLIENGVLAGLTPAGRDHIVFVDNLGRSAGRLIESVLFPVLDGIGIRVTIVEMNVQFADQIFIWLQVFVHVTRDVMIEVDVEVLT